MTLHLAALKDAITEPPAERPAFVRVAAAVRTSGYHFVTITPSSHALVNARPCNSEARTLNDVPGWSRSFSKDIITERLFGLMLEAGLLERQGALWRSKVRFSALNGDLFMHSAFPTNRKAPIHRTADGCAGAGSGAITIAKAFPGAQGLMLDINPRAVEFAAANAALVARKASAIEVASRRTQFAPGESIRTDIQGVIATADWTPVMNNASWQGQ